MRNSTRVAAALMIVAAVACNPRDDDEPAPSLNPVAPSDHDGSRPARGRRRRMDRRPPDSLSMNGTPGTCAAGSGYVRCWHFYPTMVLWVSPNSTWARNGTPFVRYLRSGFKVYCDKTIVWAGGRKIYRV